MKFIAHRINTVEQLLATPTRFGIEMDIRTMGSEMILHHDPFVDGENFERWLSNYRHGTLILNVKEEGLEKALLELMTRYGIEDFFFLDQSFPFLVKTSRGGERRCAVRVSEFEAIETVMSLAGMVEWVWVDCFTRFPLTREQAHALQSAGFKLCLVSPELQGREASVSIPQMLSLLQDLEIEAEAVCTKRPDLWGAEL